MRRRDRWRSLPLGRSESSSVTSARRRSTRSGRPLADNKGEGGSLSLLALINRSTRDKRRWTAGIVMLGVFATALFYGDSMITPAISVLSAVEGLTTVNAGLQPWVIPIAVGILVGLFAIQSHGT